MSRKDKRGAGVVKGVPRGIVISLLVHAGAFLVAGSLVVISVAIKPEAKFVPPVVVKRPKMQLKKPKVKVKKSKPKPSSRIMSAPKTSPMPEIVLPEMGGLGAGFGAGLGDGMLEMPDLERVSLMGSRMSIGNDLVGTYYDTKRGRNGRPIGASSDLYRHAANRFVRSGWNPATLKNYFRAPQKLYAQTVVVPETMATMAPLAFADEEGVGALWFVHYKGQLVSKERIKFRFWGAANEFMFVRVDQKVVLGACWNDDRRGEIVGNVWESSDMNSDTWFWGRGSVQIGDWVELEAGNAVELEIFLGDNGGSAGFMLAVEEEGVRYERSPQGAPLLPAFKTAPLSRDYLDAIYAELPEGEVCLTNGPVFCDF